MSRYFFYIYLTCMFINTIFFIPRLLLEERFSGAIMAMMIAVVLGSAYAILFMKAIAKFPGQNIADIFERMLPRAIRVPQLVFFGIMWAISGSIVLIAFATIAIRFLNPEASLTILLFCFCGICCWSSAHEPKSILFVTEIVMWLNAPVIAYIMYKSITSNWFVWDAIRILSDYTSKLPSWKALAAATYTFTGYINMAVYNREFKPAKIRMLWLVPIIGIVVLFTSIIVPVGLLGVDHVDDYIYTWITSADTLHMQFGVITRIVYLFLFAYIGFSLVFITLTWNIGAKLIASCFKKQTIQIRKLAVPMHLPWSIVFAVVTFVAGLFTTDKMVIEFVGQWLMVRWAAESFLVATIVWMAWRSVRKHG